MTTTVLLVHMLIGIALILFLILRLKINPAVALAIAAFYVGLACGLGPKDTLKAITGGFGSLMAGLGLSIGFGVMLGQLMAASGAIQSIANTIISVFSKKRSDYAMGATGFIVSIPVFYDVGYVVLMPLARTLGRSTGKHLAYFAGALVAGLGVAHTFVPPTPGPLTGSELLGIDVGTTIIWGLVIGFPTTMLAFGAYCKFFLSHPKFWNPATDEEEVLVQDKELLELEKNIKDEASLPPFWLAILPIALPIVLILMGTVTKAMYGSVSDWMVFFSDKSVAMLLGLLAAFILALKSLSLKLIEKEMNAALAPIGTVLFITGMGAAFGSVLGAAGVGKALAAAIATMHIHPILFAWCVAALLKGAQGSGTVSMITTLSLLAPSVSTMGVQPIFIALAAFSGSLMLAHVNDSAFWITTKLSGLTTSGGLKVFSLVCALQAVISLVLIFIASAIF